MRFIAFALLAVSMAGCGRSIPAVAPMPAAPLPVSIPADDMNLKQAREAAAYYQALSASLEAKAEAERIEQHKRWLSWTMGIALAGALLCFALAWVIPVGRKTLFTAALACAGTVAGAWLLGKVLAWLPLIGGLLALVAIAWVGWMLWQRLQMAIKTVDIVADKDDPSWEPLAEHVRHAQGKLQKEMKRLARRAGLGD